VAAFQAEPFDVGPDRLGHSQSIQRQQRDQRVLTRTGEACSDEHRPTLITIETGGVGLVVQAWPADMHRRRSLEQSFLDGVAVQGGDRAQPRAIVARARPMSSSWRAKLSIS
jgi:hypothetical protein